MVWVGSCSGNAKPTHSCAGLRRRGVSLFSGETSMIHKNLPNSQSSPILVSHVYLSRKTHSELRQKSRTKIQPEVFLTEVFFNPLGVMDVRAFGSWMSAPKCLFFQDFEGLTEVFAPGRPPGYPRGRPRDIRPENLLFGLLFRS